MTISAESKQSVLSDPVVRRSMDLFGGSLVEVRPARSVPEVAESIAPQAPEDLQGNAQPE